jgi:hypothetical protein
MEVKNLVFEKNKNNISWFLNNNFIDVDCPNLDTARYFSNANIILALSGEGNYPDKLTGYNVTGERIFQVPPPKNYLFSYLTTHPSNPIAVVCSGKEKIEGWYDWHFGIDSNKGTLTRLSPAY